MQELVEIITLNYQVLISGLSFNMYLLIFNVETGGTQDINTGLFVLVKIVLKISEGLIEDNCYQKTTNLFKKTQNVTLSPFDQG